MCLEAFSGNPATAIFAITVGLHKKSCEIHRPTTYTGYSNFDLEHERFHYSDGRTIRAVPNLFFVELTYSRLGCWLTR